MAAQATDQTAKAVSEPAAFIDGFTVLDTPFIFADPYLRQFNFDHARMAAKGNISHLTLDVLVDSSPLAGERVDDFSSPISFALNDDLLCVILPLNVVDPLPLEIRNPGWDAGTHKLAWM